MSSSFGTKIKVSVFGQSHSEAIGVVIDGLPAGIEIDMDKVMRFMQRRSAVGKAYATARNEKDEPEILSGLLNNRTCGASLCAIIKNTDVRSQDYKNLTNVPRPSHSDYPAYVKYQGNNDVSGGGHFSGRLTAPLCFAGAVCKQILEISGITVGAHIYSIKNIKDLPFDPINISSEQLNKITGKEFCVIDDEIGKAMQEQIAFAKSECDSVGGIVECCAVGLPCGIGEPMFDGVENRISSAIFAIPAVKGIEFGLGFESSNIFGSQNNDAYFIDDDVIKTKTNNAGGILGGITTGMPLVFRVAFKPTASIAKEQESVNLSKKENTKLIIKGRHDPCIVPRAVACVEAVCAITLLDMII